MIPYFYSYVNWHNLNTPLGIHYFIQEMKDNNVDIKNYPDLDVYYKVLCGNAFKEEPNMITVDYTVNKIKNALIRYGLAHRSAKMEKGYYYFWKGD